MGLFFDLAKLSPRRILALARLAVKEAISRWVLVAFGLFVLYVMFRSWYLTSATVGVYIDGVLWASSLLVVVVVWFLSAYSLPADIASRTIHTVVTKPVRASELVLGRILGFSFVGTALLAAAGVTSYLFVLRSAVHEHQIDAAAVTPRSGRQGGFEGNTSQAGNHRHTFTLNAEGSGATDVAQKHWHDVTGVSDSAGKRYVVGPAHGAFTSRVAIYGDLRFKDRTGAEGPGINVGDEWTYRKYIEGGTLAAAIWTFRGLRSELFPEDQSPNGIPVEMTIQVFRTYKGNIESGIPARLIARNPRTGLTTPEDPFTAREFVVDRHYLPRRWKGLDGKTYDLFKDLAPEGVMEVEITCEQDEQYFGMAKPDLYLLAGERSFAMNFLKGCLGIWLQMLLVATFGVMWSTFVNAAVSILATGGTIVFGFFIGQLQAIAFGNVLGGGLFESFERIVTQANMTQELNPGLVTDTVQTLDMAISVPLRVVTYMLPDFTRFYTSNYVVQGYDIPFADVVLENALTAAGYALPVLIAACFCLKLREVAK